MDSSIYTNRKEFQPNDGPMPEILKRFIRKNTISWTLMFFSPFYIRRYATKAWKEGCIVELRVKLRKIDWGHKTLNCLYFETADDRHEIIDGYFHCTGILTHKIEKMNTCIIYYDARNVHPFIMGVTEVLENGEASDKSYVALA